MTHIPTIIQKLSQLQRFHGELPDNDVYPDNNDLFRDQRALLAAWLDPRAITTELLKEIGFEWSGGDQCWRLFVMDADNETKVIEFYRDCRVNIGYTAGKGGGFAAKATTRGSLVRLLHSIGVEGVIEGTRIVRNGSITILGMTFDRLSSWNGKTINIRVADVYGVDYFLWAEDFDKAIIRTGK